MDPYALLFPLGAAYAIRGTLNWIFFALGLTEYPGAIHAQMMVTGFLFCFSSGFLLTAVPRFTGTPRCSPLELAIACLLALLPMAHFKPYHYGFALLLFIAAFFARRFKKRVFSPPPHFLFIPIGLTAGLVGTAVAALSDQIEIPTAWTTGARILIYHGTIQAFALGIGAKLVSALLGWAPPPDAQTLNSKSLQTVAAAQAALFASSLGLELSGFITAGVALRAICATWIALQHWKLYRRPRIRSRQSFWLWVSAWSLTLGLWGQALQPGLFIHFAHLVFVSGLGLMTFMIASRVTLAHGGHSLEIEKRSKIYATIGICIVLAALTRVSAPWSGSYTWHLAYAAGLWIAAVLSWVIFFVPKIIRNSDKETAVKIH